MFLVNASTYNPVPPTIIGTFSLFKMSSILSVAASLKSATLYRSLGSTKSSI